MTHTNPPKPDDAHDLQQYRERLKQVVAHDLRNPIAALIGFAALIEDTNTLGAEERYFLERLQETTTKLHYAVGDLIDLAWIEAEMPVAHEPVAVASVVRRAVSDLSNDDAFLDRQIELELPPVPLTVTADADQLYTAITKLIHNALTYSAPETPVIVRVWGSDGKAFVSVTDSGIGIAASEQENVFDRLYRSKHERVKAIPAGGLGLTVARKIARHFGGDVTLESVLDVGSTFTLWLPQA